MFPSSVNVVDTFPTGGRLVGDGALDIPSEAARKCGVFRSLDVARDDVKLLILRCTFCRCDSFIEADDHGVPRKSL